MQNLSYNFLQLPQAIQQEQLERFKGVCALYGYEGFFRLFNAHVIVIGNGGVGSWIAESLTRTGVGAITLIDFDNIELSNSNRQLHTLSSTIGKGKSQTLGARLQDINPHLKLKIIPKLINKNNVLKTMSQALNLSLNDIENLPHLQLHELLDPHELAARKFEQCSDLTKLNEHTIAPNVLVAEAIDDLFAKASIVDFLHRNQIPVVSSGGAGGRIDPRCVKIADITEAKGDQLIKRLRTELRRNYGYPKGLDETKSSKHKMQEEKFKILCSYSDEKPMRAIDRSKSDVAPESWGLTNPPELPSFGASNTVTATAGLLIASVIIRWIVGTKIS